MPAVYNTTTGRYELVLDKPKPVIEKQKKILSTDELSQNRRENMAKKIGGRDVSGNYDARLQGIGRMKSAAEADQTARQSAIDAFSDQVAAWQSEYDTEKQAALDAEKRAKTNTLITSIADGLTALSNVYFAAQGAPSQKLYSGTQKYMDIYTRARDKRELLQREINRKLESGNLNLAQMRAEKIASKAKSDAAIAKAQTDAELARDADRAYNEALLKAEEVRQEARADKEKHLDANDEYKKERAKVAARNSQNYAKNTETPSVTIGDDSKSVTIDSDNAIALSKLISDDLIKRKKTEKFTMTRDAEVKAIKEQFDRIKNTKDAIVFIRKYYQDSPMFMQMLADQRSNSKSGVESLDDSGIEEVTDSPTDWSQYETK